ncbi:TonB-dependent receptor plug domain-containing protein [Neolewinella persica]|uniref:TonB-dependent receptor plug domain-containing protein n=1 Tax=Neolewinella persica TaxID=70998 RepID=UPI00036CA4E8|nr:TonB-dependent receptor [Neolewinella persica]
MLFATTLQAQVPDLSTTTDEVIVTGARFTRSITESPENVTIIDSAVVAQATDLAQLLNEQPGIVINGAYSNPGKDKSIFLRNGSNQYTLILIDGQPLTDPSSLGGAVDLRLLSLDGIQRIEILRGAKSLLYGSDAVAGVINLVTSRGNASEPFTLYLRAAAQTYNTLDAGVNISGTTKKLDYRIGFDYFDTDGLSEAEMPADSTITFQEDGSQRLNLSTSFIYRPNQYLTLRPTLRIAGFNGEYDAGAFRDGDNSYTNDLLLPGLAVDYKKGKTTIGGRYTFASTDRVFEDATFGTSEFLGRSHQGDVFGTYQPTDLVALTFGTQLREEILVPDGDAENQSATTLSPYLQAHLTLARKLYIDAGFRFNNHSEFGNQSNFSIALGVQASKIWSSRVSLSNAFQSPTLDQLAGPFGANPDLKPQVAFSAEASTSLRHPAGKYALNFTAFQREIEDVIVYTSNYENQDKQLDRGVELSAVGQVSKQFSLNGSLTYVKGRRSSFDFNGLPTETEDFFRRPRTTGNIGLAFNAAKSPFTARLSGHYTGERPDVWFDANFSQFEVDLDPYFLVNAYAEYRFLKAENLRVFLDVRNLTNADFVEVTGFSTLGTVIRGGVSVKL